MSPEQLIPVAGFILNVIIGIYAQRNKQAHSGPSVTAAGLAVTGPLDSTTANLITQYNQQQRDDIISLRAEVAALRAAYDKEIRELRQANADLQSRITESELARISLSGRVDVLENERDDLLREREVLRKQLDDLRAQVNRS